MATGLRGLAAKLRSPQYRSAIVAKAAKREIERIHKANEEALGTKLAKPRIEVDGKRGAALTSVKPDGRIVATWNTETEAVRWVLNELRRASPHLTGKYEQSHTLFCDGVEHDGDGPVPPAGEYVIVNALPYARKIEGNEGSKPQSDQAPRGVYQVVAALALNRFGREAKIYFGYQGVRGGALERTVGIRQLRAGVERATGLRGKEAQRQATKLNKGSMARRFPAIFIELH